MGEVEINVRDTKIENCGLEAFDHLERDGVREAVRRLFEREHHRGAVFCLHGNLVTL